MSLTRILVTGCAGFIGSNFVIQMLDRYPTLEIIGLDKLTYAGNLENLSLVNENSRFEFIHGDISDEGLIASIMARVDGVVNFAADSMVDRSILHPGPFLQTNFAGVNVLLRAATQANIKRFLQISTQEVYGFVPEDAASESLPFNPHNVYAACKAGAEMLALAYFHSYKLPVVFTRGSNAIGRHQHPEKVTPLFITNAMENKPLPLYGDGSAVRDYIHVDDLNSANDLVLREGVIGEAYNVSSGEERSLAELAKMILDSLGKPLDLIRLVGERLGHDYRYFLSAEKIRALGWRPKHGFDETLKETVEWYQIHRDWWEKTKNTDEFREYYKSNYENKFRLSSS